VVVGPDATPRREPAQRDALHVPQARQRPLHGARGLEGEAAGLGCVGLTRLGRGWGG
jgi:hypothetical protein